MTVTPPMIGIAGWKRSGKTTLVMRLIAELTARGLKVATIKHAHHDFQIDQGEADSAKHRRAGATQVAIVSAKRWALIRELQDAPEPSLDDMVRRLDPCDLIVVEGYKRAAIPKIEVRRQSALSHAPLADTDPNVLAIASDYVVEGTELPNFALDDIKAIADFVVRTLNVAARPESRAPTAKEARPDSPPVVSETRLRHDDGEG
jgi:molybdopterin-guanine dinucleotide biosynthesis adapter protein